MDFNGLSNVQGHLRAKPRMEREAKPCKRRKNKERENEGKKQRKKARRNGKDNVLSVELFFT